MLNPPMLPPAPAEYSPDNVYAPPAEPVPAAVARADAEKLRRRAGNLLAGSVGGFVLAIVARTVTQSATLGGIIFLGSAVAALVGLVVSVEAIVKGVRGSAGTAAFLKASGLWCANLFMTGLGALSAFWSTVAFTRGRQIRSAGRVLLPPVEVGASWTGSELSASGPIVVSIEDATTRDALAAQWRENGRTEHASVAAFARLTLDLMALGAPPDLVASANRDALDEIRHTELCFGLAQALDGRAQSPGAFPEAARARTLSRTRTIALAELAVDSLIDGALHEGVSARIIAKLARRCQEPAIQAILKEIAADEGRHARHGWDVVRWCLAEGGESVARALEGAMRALPKKMASPIPDEARGGNWERWGIMGEALEAEEHEATRVDLERRLALAIASTRVPNQA